jgi:hypothetical protein
MGHVHSIWTGGTAWLEADGECGPISRKASQVLRIGSSIPGEQSISAVCGTGGTGRTGRIQA